MMLPITALLASLAAADTLPKVHLLYPSPDGSVFDRSCSGVLKDAPVIDRQWIEEAVRRAPEFQERWDSEGPSYLRVALDTIGRPFPFAEMQAALTVCPVSSMSLPLIINVRGFLASAGNRRPEWFLPLLVFHELMHTYTRPVNATSALRKKHASESPATLNHLHVMALEHLVLTKMGKLEELKWLDRDYRTASPPAYKRAWEIVNDIDSVEAFVAELRMPTR